MKEEISTKTQFSARAFINQTEFCGGAYIKTDVIDDKYKNYQILIKDCQRQIELHGKFGEKKDFENAIYKVQSLIDVLESTKKEIEERYERAKIDKKKEPKTKKLQKVKKIQAMAPPQPITIKPMPEKITELLAE